MSTPLQPSEEAEKIEEEYLKTHDPYAKSEPLNFDLRAYARYIEENGLTYKDINEEILGKFKEDK